MRRLHLLEIEDQPWCPPRLRDYATDFLQFAIHASDPYGPAGPMLKELLGEHERQVVDLCSGGGGPWSRLLPALDPDRRRLQLVLTDLYPNPSTADRLRADTGADVRHHARPVDATDVPSDLRGVRTIFSALHHFRPDAAVRILEDAVREGQPIAAFEATHRSLAGLLAVAISPIMVLVTTPLIRPFRLSRLIFTYLIPLVPLLVLWDGVVSALRTYTPDELRELVAQADAAGAFQWEIGETAGRGPMRMTYLIGRPGAA